MKITPEILEARMLVAKMLADIARGMPDGRPVEIDEDGCVWYVNYPPTTPDGSGMKILAVEYNPLENDTQMKELMEKLKVDLQWCTVDERWVIWTGDDWIIGDTINEVVVLAAYEYFKEKE